MTNRRGIAVLLVAALTIAAPSWQVVAERELYKADFERGASGWSGSTGSWAVTRSDGQGVYRQSDSVGQTSFASAGQSEWTNYSFEADVKILTVEKEGDHRISLITAWGNWQNNYSFQYLDTAGGKPAYRIIKYSAEGNETLATLDTQKPLTAGDSFNFKAVMNMGTLEFWVDGEKLLTAQDNEFTAGKIALSTAKISAEFDNIVVTSMDEEKQKDEVVTFLKPGPMIKPPMPGKSILSVSPFGIFAKEAQNTTISRVPTLVADAIYRENFENGASGWATSSGKWAVANGANGTRVYKQSDSEGSTGFAIYGESDWSDYYVEADIKILSVNAGDRRQVGLITAWADWRNNYAFQYLDTDENNFIYRIIKFSAVKNETLAYVPATRPLTPGDSYKFKVVMSQGKLEFWVDDELMVSTSDTEFTAGKIALTAERTVVEFDNITVARTKPTPVATPSPTPTPTEKPKTPEDIIKERLTDAIVLVPGSALAIIDNEMKYIDENRNVKPIIDNGSMLIPLRFMTDIMNTETLWDSEQEAVSFNVNGKTVVFTIGGDSYLIDGEVRELSGLVRIENDRTMIPLDAVTEVFGWHLFKDDKGLNVLSKKENLFDKESDGDLIDRILGQFLK